MCSIIRPVSLAKMKPKASWAHDILSNRWPVFLYTAYMVISKTTYDHEGFHRGLPWGGNSPHLSHKRCKFIHTSCNMCIHVCRLFIFSLKFLAHTDNFIPKHTNTTVAHFLLKWIFLVTTTTLWLRVGPRLLPVLLSHIHTFSHTYLLPRCHSCFSWILIELFSTKKEEAAADMD